MKNTGAIREDRQEPLFIYDGDCPFCRCWIARLERWLSFPGQYRPYEEKRHRPLIGMNEDEFKTAVVLWSPREGVLQGGEAVVRLLDLSGQLCWFVTFYHKSSLIKKCVDFAYHFVSAHRPVWTWLTFCRKYRNKFPASQSAE